MPPRSTVGVVSPYQDNTFNKDVDEWLNDKRKTDGAEGLWRIHDGLYDVSSFVSSHPGGKFWLEDTKGTDITEAFEVHHISTIPAEMLKKYFVRKALTPRSSPFTFKENGFYRTVKKRVREALKTIPKDGIKISNYYSDTMMFGTFLFAVLATLYWNYYFAAISGVLLALTSIASHNYNHQRDSWRMYYTDICAGSTRDNRIVHVLSHHMLTNTVADMQTFLIAPILNFYPEKKSIIVKYGNLIYQPLFIWPTIFVLGIVMRAYKVIKQKKFQAADLLPFVLPLVMFLFAKQTFLMTFLMWIVVLVVGGFLVAAISFTGTHFHPDIFIDGDTPRSEAERDWGINQLDSISDRHEITGNHFLVLVTFGDHALHHLFPTLDHGILQHLYPIVEETAKEFNLNIRMTTSLDMFTGYFRQIARETPNPNPPNLNKPQ